MSESNPPSPILQAITSNVTGRVLQPLLHLATAASFYFHLREFLDPSYVLGTNPDAAYVLLLTAYAGHREVRRWVEDPDSASERARRGEFFIVFWWLFYYVTVIAANHHAGYRVPADLFPLCVQITTIFFGTLTSQQLFKRNDARAEQKAGGPTAIADRVIEILKRSSTPKKRADIQAELGVSASTVTRTLRQLLAEGRIRWTGKTESDPEGGYELVR